MRILQLDRFSCRRQYLADAKVVQFTHHHYGHVNLVQPSVVPCGTGSGCGISLDTGTGAPATRAVVAKKDMMMYSGNIVVLCVLEGLLSLLNMIYTR